jgi:hypothetical protein
MTLPITDPETYVRFWRLVIVGCGVWAAGVWLLLFLIWRK